jgi:heterodisulfide reductase subunit C
MAQVVDTALLPRLKHYGAFEVSACFQCGNCTAVCPLSGDRTNFPRRLIRYAQVGMEDRLLADRDLWLCYSCGECTQTCPRQASPSEFMAAARRYAVSRADATGLARVMYGSKLGLIAAFLAVSAAVMLLLLSRHGTMGGPRPAFFEFVPGRVVHTIGIAVLVVLALNAAAGLGVTIYRMLRQTPGLRFSPRLIFAAAAYAVAESLAQSRYRGCGADQETPRWYLRPWLVHGAVLWGFLGMLAATAFDFLFKPIGSAVPPWYPARLFGTAAGLLCLAGLSVIAARRFRKADPALTTSHFSDWFLIGLLFAVVATGLATEVAVYLPASHASYLLFLGHVVLAMDLTLLLPVTKLAHVLYRPLALFTHRWQELAAMHPSEAQEAA